MNLNRFTTLMQTMFWLASVNSILFFIISSYLIKNVHIFSLYIFQYIITFIFISIASVVSALIILYIIKIKTVKIINIYLIINLIYINLILFLSNTHILTIESNFINTLYASTFISCSTLYLCSRIYKYIKNK